MNQLNKDLLSSDFKFPADIKVSSLPDYPEKVLQFGEGNFLRGFADWMIHQLNKKGEFGGKVVVVQPIAQGLAPLLNEQDGLYTLYLRGIQNGAITEEKEVISSISRAINPYEDYTAFLACAENPDLRVIISNTTEAGIAYDATDTIDMAPPKSFPAKLTAFLYHRFKTFEGASDKGLIMLACELIDHNGQELKKIVLRLAKEWNLGDDFTSWVDENNYILSTLVDRIVTGYPRAEIDDITKENGYSDSLLDTAEIFHFWVIEGPKHLAKEIPFDKIGLNVIWTDDVTPYKSRKVRILNGAHTMMVLGAYLAGKDTVKECMDDSEISDYMKKGLFEEIIPTLDLPEEELTSFANSVIERFSNPFICHYLLSISLNSTSKWKARVMPSLIEYINRFNKVPTRLAFSLAALIAFYRGTQFNEKGALIGTRGDHTYEISDDKSALEFFADVWKKPSTTLEEVQVISDSVLKNEDFWGQDLTLLQGFAEKVSAYLYSILKNGVKETIQNL